MRSQAGRRVTGWPCYRRGGQADRGEPRPGAVELGGDHVLDAGLQQGVRGPGLKSGRAAGPPCRARAVPCLLTPPDRDHAARANPARGAGYHALFRALVSLTQYIRRSEWLQNPTESFTGVHITAPPGRAVDDTRVYPSFLITLCPTADIFRLRAARAGSICEGHAHPGRKEAVVPSEFPGKQYYALQVGQAFSHVASHQAHRR